MDGKPERESSEEKGSESFRPVQPYDKQLRQLGWFEGLETHAPCRARPLARAVSRVPDIRTEMMQPDSKDMLDEEPMPSSISTLRITADDYGAVEGEMPYAYEDGTVYKGQWSKGQPNGHGEKTWSDGRVYRGEFQDGKANGIGSYIHKDGSKYVGPVMNDKPHGSTGFSITAGGAFYHGEFVQGKEHGEGSLTQADCSIYIGQFRNGLKSGTGTEQSGTLTEYVPSLAQWVTLPSGIYEGEFLADCFHGKGVYTWPDGRRYQGQWATNFMHGHGTFTFADARKYEGQYRHGEKSGEGSYSWPDGRSYVGQILNGTRHGRGVYTDARGKRRVGVWHRGSFTASMKSQK